MIFDGVEYANGFSMDASHGNGLGALRFCIACDGLAVPAEHPPPTGDMVVYSPPQTGVQT
eukprot:CAMPEP_0178435828 /NCGR_PEP_ID=MMETSP0689_2-20121128/34129_1 /TAXON_ID=160604 /ORGANISM="Amphidinium massartii, Strain CS-259" /LENGTH=59 /DNA_ID=CAMNT_0020057913 /DNA_START=885 /DNA_END=1064 /DNA_ORIENTATION=-